MSEVLQVVMAVVTATLLWVVMYYGGSRILRAELATIRQELTSKVDLVRLEAMGHIQRHCEWQDRTDERLSAHSSDLRSLSERMAALNGRHSP